MSRKLTPFKLSIIIAIVLAAIVIPGSVFFFAPGYLVSISHVSYVFLIVAIVLLITPQTTSLQTKTLPWLMKIILAQCALGLLFFSTMHTLLTYIPLENLTLDDTSLKNISHHLLFNAGFHPWPMIAVLSCAFAYLYSASTAVPASQTVVASPALFAGRGNPEINTPGLLHPQKARVRNDELLGSNERKLAILSSFFPSFQNPAVDIFFKRAIQVILSIATQFSVAITISIGAVQIAALFSTPTYGMSPTIILCGIILLGFMGSNVYRQGIQILCEKKLSVGGFLATLLCIISLLLIISNRLAPEVQAFFGELNVSSSQSIHFSMSKPIWQLTIWAWWIGWASLISSFIARISIGRSFREIILGTLFFPAVCLMIFNSISGNLASINLGGNILALSGPMMVILLFAKSQDSHLLMLGWMPHQTGNMYAAPRRTIKFIYPFLQSIVLLSFLYLVLGFTLFCLFIFLATFCCFLIFVAVSLFVLFLILRVRFRRR